MSPVSSTPRRVLICRTDRLGDMILALPCVNLVKAMFPACRVDLLVSPYTAPVAWMFTAADDVLELGPESPRLEGYDAAIVLYPSYALARLLSESIPFRAGIAYRWYSRLFFTYRHPEHRKTNLKHEAEYNLSLTYAAFSDEGKWEDLLPPSSLFPLSLSIPDADVQKAAGLINAAEGEKLVALHPGGSGSAHRWKAEYYADLVARLATVAQIRLVVTGGVGEEALCKSVARAGGERAQDLCGKLSLTKLAALYRRCRLLVANSTGPLHLARALGVNVLGLFPNDKGMTPKRWGPYGLPGSALTPPRSAGMDKLAVESVLEAVLKSLGEAS